MLTSSARQFAGRALNSGLSRLKAVAGMLALVISTALVLGFSFAAGPASRLIVTAAHASTTSLHAATSGKAAHHRIFSWTVRPGNSLSQISGVVYGRPQCWPGIYDANKKIIGGNPGLIEPGQRLFIPAKCTTALPAAASQPPAHHGSPSAPPVVLTSAGSPQADAERVFGAAYSCAAWIITRESGWNVYATNPSSGAYGLPQSLPGSKMASAGADWQSDPMTQLLWMRSYVNASYGGACAAQAFWEAHGWY